MPIPIDLLAENFTASTIQHYTLQHNLGTLLAEQTYYAQHFISVAFDQLSRLVADAFEDAAKAHFSVSEAAPIRSPNGRLTAASISLMLYFVR
jgi:hypothetical protein